MHISPTPGFTLLGRFSLTVRAEWLSQTNISYLETEAGQRLENQTGFWSYRNGNLRYVLWSSYIMPWFSLCQRCFAEGKDTAAPLTDLHSLQKAYWLNRIEPPQIYIFFIFPNALEGQHSIFGNWKCLPNSRCEEQKLFWPGWVINGTNVFAVCRAAICVYSLRQWKCYVLRSALTNLWTLPAINWEEKWNSG